MENKRGKLISFEGGERAGKTEQSKILEGRLADAGLEVVRLREPGGTGISEQIREVVLSAKNQKLTDRTEVLLFQAARAQIYGEVVLPALSAGKVVLMDRTRDSSVVYQGMVRNMGVELIEKLNDISTQGTVPDLTILLDVSPEVGLKRRTEVSELDRIEMLNHGFHQKVREAYLELAKEDKDGRWVAVDAEAEFDQVSAEIWRIVSGKLELT